MNRCGRRVTRLSSRVDLCNWLVLIITRIRLLAAAGSRYRRGLTIMSVTR